MPRAKAKPSKAAAKPSKAAATQAEKPKAERPKAEKPKAEKPKAEKPKAKKATEDKKKKNEKKAAAAKGGKRRRKPGQLVMKEIRQLQKTTHRLLAKAPFTRMVRNSMMAAVERIGKPFLAPQFKPAALECLQDAAEAYMLRFFEDAQTACLHAGRKTLMQKDLAFVKLLRPELGGLVSTQGTLLLPPG